MRKGLSFWRRERNTGWQADCLPPIALSVVTLRKTAQGKKTSTEVYFGEIPGPCFRWPMSTATNVVAADPPM